MGNKIKKIEDIGVMQIEYLKDLSRVNREWYNLCNKINNTWAIFSSVACVLAIVVGVLLGIIIASA